MKNSNKYFWKSELESLNFNILSALKVFDGVESISTIKNAIQTLHLPDFLKYVLSDSSKKLHILNMYFSHNIINFKCLLIYISLTTSKKKYVKYHYKFILSRDLTNFLKV